MGRRAEAASPSSGNNNRDVGKWMKPINPTPILLALILGFSPAGGAVGAAANYLSENQSQEAVYDCNALVAEAYDAHDADPTRTIWVTGPAEDKCDINEAVQRYAKKNTAN